MHIFFIVLRVGDLSWGLSWSVDKCHCLKRGEWVGSIHPEMFSISSERLQSEYKYILKVSVWLNFSAMFKDPSTISSQPIGQCTGQYTNISPLKVRWVNLLCFILPHICHTYRNKACRKVECRKCLKNKFYIILQTPKRFIQNCL